MELYKKKVAGRPLKSAEIDANWDAIEAEAGGQIAYEITDADLSGSCAEDTYNGTLSFKVKVLKLVGLLPVFHLALVVNGKIKALLSATGSFVGKDYPLVVNEESVEVSVNFALEGADYPADLVLYLQDMKGNKALPYTHHYAHHQCATEELTINSLEQACNAESEQVFMLNMSSEVGSGNYKLQYDSDGGGTWLDVGTFTKSEDDGTYTQELTPDTPIAANSYNFRIKDTDTDVLSEVFNLEITDCS